MNNCSERLLMMLQFLHTIDGERRFDLLKFRCLVSHNLRGGYIKGKLPPQVTVTQYVCFCKTGETEKERAKELPQ